MGGPLAKVGSSAKLCVLVDLPGDLPIWALMVNIWNCHSYQLAHLWGVHLPGHLLRSALTTIITYYTWQIWALIVETFNYHVGVSRGLHLTWIYNANWVLTNLIIQKYKEIPTFTWRIQHGCQIHPIIYIQWCILGEGTISQSRFICQVLCTGIQGIYALFWGVHWPKYVHLPADLPRSALSTILHIKPGKYDPS